MRLGAPAAATSTPTGVFNQRFEALFPPCWSPGLCGLLHSPSAPPSLFALEHGTAGSTSRCPVRSASCPLPTLLHNMPPCWVRQPSPYHKSSPPGCPSLPLLPVWMNVSSLSPWLLDLHTVRFSVSSSCFLFLNCCCPSFGCTRRHSVSTYASILARSHLIFQPFSMSGN